MKMPLTLEQVFQMSTGMIYLEYKYPEYSSHYMSVGKVKAWWANPNGPNRALYGKTWRCWAEKPTDEERTNAVWEEI